MNFLKIAAMYLQPLLWAGILAVILNTTAPLTIGPAGILGVFFVIYMLMSSLLFTACVVLSKAIQLFIPVTIPRRRVIYYIASIIALGPLFLIALNTLGSIGLKEVLLVVVLVAVSCFYVTRTMRSA